MARIFGVSDELNSELFVQENPETQTRTIERCLGPSARTLPGNPFVELGPDAVFEYIKKTMMTRELNQSAKYFWLLGTKSSSSISPLHMQVVLGRTIIRTEGAQLHLLWYHNKIFIKPLPSWLLSSAFWDFFLESPNLCSDKDQDSLYRAATGFVRSYAYLIQSELDFDLAVRHSLIPQGITLEGFAKFIQLFGRVSDDMVSPRFQYGELRLSRINKWSIFLFHRMEYFNMSRQYEAYFSRYFQFFLFVFATFTLLLSAMQVALAVEQVPSNIGGSWTVFSRVCRWTAVTVMAFVTFIGMGLGGMFACKILDELGFAVRHLSYKSC